LTHSTGQFGYCNEGSRSVLLAELAENPTKFKLTHILWCSSLQSHIAFMQELCS